MGSIPIRVTILKSKKNKMQKKVDFQKLNDFLLFLDSTLEDKEDYQNFKRFIEMLSKSSGFSYKAHKELQHLKLNEPISVKEFYVLIVCNGHNLEGTYPYVITYFNDVAEVEKLEEEYPGIEILYIYIDDIPKKDVIYNGEKFQCEFFDQERARLKVVKDWSYPKNLVICSDLD
jgi:hypothetical protein